MPLAPIIIIAGLIALAVFGSLYNRKKARERQEILAELAAELGLEFDPQRDSTHDDRYANFEVFRRGRSRAAYNTLVGETTIRGIDYPVVMGDFIYRVTRSSGKNRSTQTYRFSYAILHLPYPAVPDLLIRPEGLFDKLGAALGFDDIDFESAEFSKKFVVKSPDKRFAYDVITPFMIEMLLEHQKPPTIDMEHGMLCLTDGVSRWTPQQFRDTLEFADSFFSLWPEHVVLDLSSRARDNENTGTA